MTINYQKSWNKLKSENDDLVKAIKEINDDYITAKREETKLGSEVSKDIKEITQNHQKDKALINNVDSMIKKINELINDDESVRSSESKSSETYKTEIKHLKEVINLLMSKLTVNEETKEE